MKVDTDTRLQRLERLAPAARGKPWLMVVQSGEQFSVEADGRLLSATELAEIEKEFRLIIFRYPAADA